MKKGGLWVVFCLPALAFANALDDLPVGQWTTVGTNTMYDVRPCPTNDCSYLGGGVQNTVDVWCGGGMATRQGSAGNYLAGWCGGHNAYFGNELYFFDVETLSWSISHTPPYDGAQFPTSSNNAGCADDATGECCTDGTLGCKGFPGQPCALHSYNLRVYSPQSNQFHSFREYCGTRNESHGWDFGTNGWFFPNVPTVPVPNGTSATTVFDSRRNRQVFLGNNSSQTRIVSYDFATQGWSAGARPLIYGRDTNADYDPTRDIAVLVNFRIDDPYKYGIKRGIYVYDMSDLNQLPWVTDWQERAIHDGFGILEISPPTESILPAQSAPGFKWDPVSGKFVLWPCDPSGVTTPATSVCTLTPPPTDPITGTDWKTGTWVWEEVRAAPGNNVTPPLPQYDDPNYVYTRFQYIPSKNIFLYIGDVQAPVYAYRLTAARSAPECSDGRDNDGDALIDLADPSCLSAAQAVEGVPDTTPPAEPANVRVR